MLEETGFVGVASVRIVTVGIVSVRVLCPNQLSQWGFCVVIDCVGKGCVGTSPLCTLYFFSWMCPLLHWRIFSLWRVWYFWHLSVLCLSHLMCTSDVWMYLRFISQFVCVAHACGQCPVVGDASLGHDVSAPNVFPNISDCLVYTLVRCEKVGGQGKGVSVGRGEQSCTIELGWGNCTSN